MPKCFSTDREAENDQRVTPLNCNSLAINSNSFTIRCFPLSVEGNENEITFADALSALPFSLELAAAVDMNREGILLSMYANILEKT